MSTALVPPPIFLGSEKLAAAAAEASADADERLFTRVTFADGSMLFTMRTVVLPLDAERSQFSLVAQMCIAVYAYQWLEAASMVDVGSRAQLRRAFRPWHLQLRIMNEFWLSKQRKPHESGVRCVAEVLEGDHCDCAMLRRFLDGYLAARGLPADAAPRLLQHKRLFAEYFSCFEHQICRSTLFDHCLHVFVDSAAGSVGVGAVALGGYGQGNDAAVMQVWSPNPRMSSPKKCATATHWKSAFSTLDSLSGHRRLPVRFAARAAAAGEHLLRARHR